MGKDEKYAYTELEYYRFGSIAHLRGYVTLLQIQRALAEQVEDNVSAKIHRHLGTILREKGWITEEQETSILEEMWEKASRKTATKIE
jgi:hypothetical protein